MKFQRKFDEVDAIQFSAAKELPKGVFADSSSPTGYFFAERVVPVTEGDWIITHASGERSLLHDTAFAANYEAKK